MGAGGKTGWAEGVLPAFTRPPPLAWAKDSPGCRKADVQVETVPRGGRAPDPLRDWAARGPLPTARGWSEAMTLADKGVVWA